MTPQELNQELGNIDIYLLDAILKGYFPAGSRVLDAGCGEGRNLHWLLKNGYEAWGVDKNPSAIRMLRYVANSLQKGYPAERFDETGVEEMHYPPAAFDAVISSAVLHFAENEAHFRQMWAEMYRVLKPGGVLFIRTATLLGMNPDEVQKTADGKYLLPDGSYRFVLSATLLADLLRQYPVQWLEPLKSVLVANQRSMGVLVLKKSTAATEA
ncbi:bifunctional 2-polyprenyl-6-hydroxyphenol methylase/3-demethylubiquinol 3-O-methyltransferase UbiG [Cesiribacter sp. SM1]|uniref:class I SAM-dependent methyltransferase n=1 Tax=Cesiribacter sp. SM1 TaxID=2861196 RepID=UPI001CD4E28B|nr:class I SAM-dependent methyltransferase [Cesiribacter sp. SM1]